MKRRLLIMNEKGFFLPYVLIVAVIMLTIITTSILIYKTEVESTQFFIDQLELETIIQMGRAQFKAEEVYKNHNQGQVTYIYPYGEIFIKYRMENEQTVFLELQVKTDSNVITHTQNRLLINP